MIYIKKKSFHHMIHNLIIMDKIKIVNVYI